MKTIVVIVFCFFILLASCQQKSHSTSLDKSTDKSDSIETYHTIVSDDSLVTAIWHDTGKRAKVENKNLLLPFIFYSYLNI